MPAMPNPLIMYSAKSIQTLETRPEASSIKGTKNKAIIMTVLTTIVALAFLLLFWVLK